MANQNVIVTLQDNIQIVKFNKPEKKNAFDGDMYVQLTSILNRGASDDRILMTVLTGEGDFYSSGTDLSNSAISNSGKSIENALLEAKTTLKSFVESFINFPKILIAIVNGPAVGIAATTLALCDFVFASEKAFFYTPFTKLGLCAEGCSTYTFPRLLGRRKAIEMLLFNHKMSSIEALECGFVNEIFTDNEVQTKVWNKIHEYASLPKATLCASKKLLTDFDKDSLILANTKECDELSHRWISEEFLNSIAAFSKKRSQL